jgi:hypothetical protein
VAGANPLIVITDPSDPEAVLFVCCPLQDTFVALADTVTLIGSPIVTVVVAVQSPSAFPLAAVATTVFQVRKWQLVLTVNCDY